jgi:hypothetical protein
MLIEKDKEQEQSFRPSLHLEFDVFFTTAEPEVCPRKLSEN